MKKTPSSNTSVALVVGTPSYCGTTIAKDLEQLSWQVCYPSSQIVFGADRAFDATEYRREQK
jgi:hypothetical protein